MKKMLEDENVTAQVVQENQEAIHESKIKYNSKTAVIISIRFSILCNYLCFLGMLCSIFAIDSPTLISESFRLEI